jgi:8-oxo-dGTP pyrophosphatase MutT (NUDIX family)
MLNLEKFQARVCQTTCAFVIHRSRILLVKHKKLGIWLAPGGHIDEGELPHQTALRECVEETGLKAQVLSPLPLPQGKNSQYFPSPFAVNLHWISQENYHARLQSKNPTLPHATKKWPRGCEQHLVYCYLVKPVGPVQFKQNIQETDGIGWFSLSKIKTLETTPDIKQEITLAFKLYQKIH